jgi:hypothetical protein
MKKYIRLICISLLFIFVTGCATQAEIRRNAIQKALDEGAAKNRACRDAMKSNPSVLYTFNNIMLENDASTNKFTLLTSDQKIDKEMQQQFINYMNENSKCRILVIEIVSKIHSGLLIPVLESQRKIDTLFAELLSNQVTIGEFNRKLQENRSQFDREWSMTLSSINKELAENHNYEMQNRQRAALLMQNWSAQQQQLYQNQMLYNNLNRPRYTNCNVFGNTVNCSTY